MGKTKSINGRMFSTAPDGIALRREEGRMRLFAGAKTFAAASVVMLSLFYQAEAQDLSLKLVWNPPGGLIAWNPTNGPTGTNNSYNIDTNHSYEVVSYIMYCGPASGMYTNWLYDITNRTVVIGGLHNKNDYFFAVSAVVKSISGELFETVRSNEVKYSPSEPLYPPTYLRAEGAFLYDVLGRGAGFSLRSGDTMDLSVANSSAHKSGLRIETVRVTPQKS